MEQLNQGGKQTVTVRVQAIDMNSFTLDLMVPTYLPARDLTQRVARDAGLDAYWEDGGRRLYWLRARGRLLNDDETLGQLGVIDGELVYLLPEPPPGSGVMEQPPDYPETKGYAGKGTINILGAVLGVMVWAVGWGLALTIDRNSWTILLPGLGMGFLCTSLSRHMWGGQGNQTRIAVTSIIFFLLVFVVAFLPAAVLDENAAIVYSESVQGFVVGLVGVFMGWLAWWGAVEPLPESQAVTEAQTQTTMATVTCDICGGDVTPDVRTECQYGCGKYFHTGCYQARVAVYRGDARHCAICNAQVR